jgi:hypothetical protein
VKIDKTEMSRRQKIVFENLSVSHHHSEIDSHPTKFLRVLGRKFLGLKQSQTLNASPRGHRVGLHLLASAGGTIRLGIHPDDFYVR